MKTETLIILFPGFPANEADSTCLPSQQLFVKILKERYPMLQVIVLAFQYPFVTAEYDWYDCRVIALGGKGRSKLYRLLLWRRAWKKLKEISKESRVIGLFSFWCGECALIGNRFGRKYNIKHYCWIMGQDAKKENKYVNRIKPSSSELIALSDFVQTVFNKNHSICPAQVIPNGIDPLTFPGGSATRDIDIFGAGSLIPLKQYDLFVEVINTLKLELPAINAMLCGKGTEENKLRQLIRQYHLQDNLILTGELSHQEILRRMQRSRVFLHTSAYEGFGAVFLEALYAGAQVISFCKPMDDAISHWHVVQTKEEMINKTIDILNDGATEYKPVLPYTTQDAVDKIMQLFGK